MAHAQIPVHCPSCGAIFQSRGISISGNVKNITLSGNRESCPFCGKLANIADGVFEVADNILSVISAPNVTKEMLSKLGVVAKKAYEEHSPPEEVAKIADQIDPSFGKIVRSLSLKQTLYTTGLLLILLAAKSCSLNITLDANKLVGQLNGTQPNQVISGQAIEK